MGGSSKNFFSQAADVVRHPQLNKLGADPYGYVASKITGQDIKLSPVSLGYERWVAGPKREKQKAIDDQINQATQEARQAETAYKQEQTEERKRAHEMAQQKLARLQNQYQHGRGGRSGTILTSPLGITGDPAAGGQRTLLGT